MSNESEQSQQYQEVLEKAAKAPPTPIIERKFLKTVLNRLNIFRKNEIYPRHYETDQEYWDALQRAADVMDKKEVRHRQGRGDSSRR